MNTKNKLRRIKAFTILEATIVMAIISILISIIGTATNRFGEQLKNSSDISHELNEWNAFSSNLWRELYFSDSINTSNNSLIIYNLDGATEYSIKNELILRKKHESEIPTNINASRIYTEKTKGASLIIIDFLWKGEIMSLKFYNKPDLESQINSYFEKL